MMLGTLAGPFGLDFQLSNAQFGSFRILHESIDRLIQYWAKLSNYC